MSPEARKALERVARLNPDAGEIGAGMLRTIVEEAQHALAEKPTRWAQIDPQLIANECSPRHIQSVLEAAQKQIERMDSAMRTVMEAHKFNSTSMKPTEVHETLYRALEAGQ